MEKKRTECVICGSNSIKELLSFKNMPVYVGVTDKKDYIFNDMIFCNCLNCKNIQLFNTLDPNIVYSHNHNIEIVGDLWRNHYIEFLKFIDDKIKDKNILEIGDPSAKIAKLTNIYKKWIIVEKNTHLESSGKIEFRQEFFDDNFKIDEEIDVIIHSHLLEHIYEPIKFLNKCKDILSENGDIFFSIPNMKNFIDKKYSPNSILNFEHTYYIDEYYVKKLCDQIGLKIVNKKLFNEHSVFYHLKKDNIKDCFYDQEYDLSNNFLELFDIHTKKINEINEIILNEKNVFLYGSHITSQFYIFNGLNCDNIIGILDGSASKVNKYLYGTYLKTLNISEILKYDKLTIIVSHMGVYVDEISKTLINIKKDIKLI